MARTTGSDGERTEAAIREAAVDLFARRGYEAVTTRQIAPRSASSRRRSTAISPPRKTCCST